ncbi:MAG: metal ABC transporter ATP-binding protein [Anaerolineae bacterium]
MTYPAGTDQVRRHGTGDGGVVLEAQDLTVVLGGHRVLEHVSFGVRDGQRVAVVGPNGAGKTTLLKAIAGILPVTGGSLLVHGHPPGRTCVAYIPQRSEIDWSFPLTVANVVMMGRAGRLGLFHRPGRRDREIVAESLAAVGVAPLADRTIANLSGGEGQRMFIARALAQEAELFLMDEPFAALDARSKQDVVAALGELQARGMTVVVATHDLEAAARHFEAVLLLEGRLVAAGPPGEVLNTSNLLAAYGSHVHVIETPDGRLLIGGTWCPEEAPEPERDSGG